MKRYLIILLFIPVCLNAQVMGAWWMNGDATDRIGLNNGTTIGVTYASGKLNQGGVFGGTSTTAKFILTTNAFNFTTAYSVSALIKTTTTDKTIFCNYNRIVSVGLYGYNTAVITHKAWMRQILSSSSSVSISGSTSIDDGKWHYVVFSWDGSYLYVDVDGKSDATPVACASYRYAASMYPRIGYDTSVYEGAVDYFNGMIDEVMLFQPNLTPVQIKNMNAYYKGIYQ